MNLEDTILEQNQHWREKDIAKNYTSRDLLEEIKLSSKFIEIITGVRRSGKSTIFNLLISNLINQKKVDPKEILLINFDHPVFIPYYGKVNDLDKIVEQAQILTKNKIKYIFLDEIQNIDLWEKWIKAKYDAGVFRKIFVSGSNADLLESQYITRLSGRYFAHINFPFSFKEFLRAKGQIYYSDYTKNYSIKYKLIPLFNEYLKLGGFPEVVIDSGKDILTSYYQTIILKDVIASNQIRDVYGLKQTAYHLISNVANLFSYNQIGKDLDIHESTIAEYIEHLKQAYLFEDLKKFDYSTKAQNRNPRKIYCIDNGLIERVALNFSLNYGRYLENLVFLELKRRFGDYYYHSRENECDFVVADKNNQGKTKIKQAFQVCYTITQKNKERELQGLLEAMKDYNLSRGVILTYNQNDTIRTKGKEIAITPVWRWLLEN